MFVGESTTESSSRFFSDDSVDRLSVCCSEISGLEALLLRLLRGSLSPMSDFDVESVNKLGGLSISAGELLRLRLLLSLGEIESSEDSGELGKDGISKLEEDFAVRLRLGAIEVEVIKLILGQILSLLVRNRVFH